MNDGREKNEKPYLGAVALIYHDEKSSSTTVFACHHGDGA